MFGAANAATQRLAQGVYQKTGMQMHGDRFAGHFQGMQAWSKTEMVADMGSLAIGSGGGMLGGLGALMGSGGGMVHGMTGGDFLMKHDYVIELPQWSLPGGSLRETTSWLINKGIQQRNAIGQRTRCGVPWIDQRFEVCSNDPKFIHYVCTEPQFQQWLSHWPFVNLSWEPQRVWLELLDSTRRLYDKFGTQAMQDGDMVYRGMSVVAAAARACGPRTG
jgi:hypothetical protein